MKFCNYLLNLILIDYKISMKHKEDIIAISSMVFASYQNDFADTDSLELIKYFSMKKEKLIEENESNAEIK